MSNLRILGLLVGLLGLTYAFISFRGPKWRKSGFLLFSSTSLILIVVTINPGSINFVRDLLSLSDYLYGRLIALLIFSSLFLLFLTFSISSKLGNLKSNFDALVRNLTAAELSDIDERDSKLKPIMVIILAYNEEENLRKLLPRIPRMIGDIEVGVLVIDDGSEDGTADVAKEFGHLVLSYPVNRGQGAASRLGYHVLQKYNIPYGVTMDGDNQHDPGDIEKLVRPVIEGKYDLVIGSRILGKQEETARLRHLGIMVFSKILGWVTGMRITDCSSGYKAFSIERFKAMNLTEDQFQSAEVLIEARKRDLRIGEVPIVMNRRAHGKSKKGREWSYGFHFAKTIVRAWWK